MSSCHVCICARQAGRLRQHTLAARAHVGSKLPGLDLAPL